MSTPSASSVLSLYRQILRLHRSKLTPEKRKLGDLYVQKEFRDHRQAKPEFVRAFVAEWSRYAHHLETQRDVGAPLPAELLSSLSPEQLTVLSRLEKEARAVRQKSQ